MNIWYLYRGGRDERWTAFELEIFHAIAFGQPEKERKATKIQGDQENRILRVTKTCCTRRTLASWWSTSVISTSSHLSSTLCRCVIITRLAQKFNSHFWWLWVISANIYVHICKIEIVLIDWSSSVSKMMILSAVFFQLFPPWTVFFIKTFPPGRNCHL